MSEIHINTTISMTELKRNPSILKQLSDSQPTAILSRNKPIAYLLSTRAYESLLELIDEAILLQTVIARKNGKTIKIKT
jgi:antitoxin StbD